MGKVALGGFMGAHPLTMAIEMIQFILAFGQVAQLVEQRTENPRAEGSNPPLTTMEFDRTEVFNCLCPVFYGIR